MRSLRVSCWPPTPVPRYNVAMDEEQVVKGRASLGRATKKGFRAAYDHLGYVVFITLVSFVAGAGLFSGGIAVLRAMPRGMWSIVLILPAVLGWFLCAVGAFYFANKSVYHEHPGLGDTWLGVKRLLAPALSLFVVDLILTAVLAGDVVFFLGVLGAKGNIVFIGLGVLCGYVLLVWLMMSMYHLPLLIAQTTMESGPKTFVILRKAFLLTADNPAFTVGLFLVIIAFAVLCAIPAGIGMALVYLGGIAFVLTHALRELFVKYGVVEEEPEVPADPGWPK